MSGHDEDDDDGTQRRDYRKGKVPITSLNTKLVVIVIFV